MSSASGVPHLDHLPLRALGEDQDLVVERIQRLPDRLGLLLGHAGPVLQEVHLDVGRWNHNNNNNNNNNQLIRHPPGPRF